jgi:hypothetical protein
MGIETKTVGVLIDELITTDIKCWFSQESLMNSAISANDRLNNAINTHKLNKRRNELIRAIDTVLGQGENSPTEKTY